ncbi:hypothetical protein [Motilimonas cestriensis]|uniref:hypothetical protein n=1 Tax=Motilimonas cestriensis TaxID=2742685 RepID=UPI003DA63A3A
MWQKHLTENGLHEQIHSIEKLFQQYQGTEKYLHESFEPNNQLTQKIENHIKKNRLTESNLNEIVQNLSIFCVKFLAMKPIKQNGYCGYWQPAMQNFSEFSAKQGVLQVVHQAQPVTKPLSIISCLKKDTQYAQMANTQYQ